MRRLISLALVSLFIGCSGSKMIIENHGGKTDSTRAFGKGAGLDKKDSTVSKEAVKTSNDKASGKIDLETLHKEGLELYQSGKYDEALPDWMKIVDLADGHKELLAEAHYVIGDIFFQKDEYSKAEIEFKRTLIYDSAYVDAIHDLGLVYYMKENYDDALAQFSKVLAILPGDSTATASYNYTMGSRSYYDGIKQFKDESYDKAITHFKSALNYLDNDSSFNYLAYYFLGSCYKEKLDYEAAISYLKKSLDVNPRFADGYIEIGNINFARRAFDDAIASNEKAIAIKPTSAKAHNNLGYIFFTMGNDAAVNNKKPKSEEFYKKSISLFEKALEMDPDFVEAKANLDHVKMIISGARKVAAYSLFQQAVKTDNPAQKLVQYQKIIAEDSTYDDAYNNLAVAYYYEGKVDSAVVTMERALAINRYNPQAHNNLGYMLGTLHKYDEALNHLFLAIQIKRDYFDAYINLSYVYMWKEEFDKSRALLVQLLKLDPNNKLARQAQSQLDKREKLAKNGETNTKIIFEEDPNDKKN